MREIRFQVKGHLPPKKDSGSSMWSNEGQLERLIALRSEAKKVLGEPFKGDVQLTLRLRVGDRFLRKRSHDPKNFGDIDALVGGVFDGLMKAPRTDRGSLHPSFCAFEDDAQVIKMDAEKDVGQGDHCDYEIAIAPCVLR